MSTPSHTGSEALISTGRSKSILTTVLVGLLVITCITILGISIATLVNVQENQNQNVASDTGSLSLSGSIQVEQVMDHLKELQKIADQSGGTRAVKTIGFNRTLDYITSQLRSTTNFNVTTDFFEIRGFALGSDPILTVSINGSPKNYTYDSNLSKADFYQIEFSTESRSTEFADITVIPGLGCNETDWTSAVPAATGRIVLVKRGVCAFDLKGRYANQFGASGILIYNDGAAPDRQNPLAIGLGQDNQIPALFLSYKVGQELFDAIQNQPLSVKVRMTIDALDVPKSPVGNICADTPTGDPTKIIIIGSHSDSVPAGPGINDNGSGSAANLALATTLARLMKTGNYPEYKYRIRFCWWGAEEVGLLGSEDHVKKANRSQTPGERLKDYLINLNYDMLGSPNYMFGIYDGDTADPSTPKVALPGSKKVTSMFVDWFEQKKLPWNYTEFSGRSDYGPFLAEGIVAGGLFSGGDQEKSLFERDYYDRMLGPGLGGIAGINHDPCYHMACDSIANINVFALEKMTQAAAHALEYLALKENLEEWLYPEGRQLSRVSSMDSLTVKSNKKMFNR